MPKYSIEDFNNEFGKTFQVSSIPVDDLQDETVGPVHTEEFGKLHLEKINEDGYTILLEDSQKSVFQDFDFACRTQKILEVDTKLI